MTRTTRTSLAGALLGGLLLVTAGCGGGGGSTPSTTGAADTHAATTSVTQGSGGNLGSLASASNCRELAGLGNKLAAAFSGGKTQDIEKQAQLLKEFAARTPAEIRPDFEVVANAFGKIAGSLKGLNLTSGKAPTPAQIAKLQGLAGKINQAQLQKASTHIAAWAAKNCKAP